MTESQRALAALGDDTPADHGAPVETRRRTPVFIIASPRPLTGKTFLARLITDFLRLDGGRVKAFDLNPSEGALVEFPAGRHRQGRSRLDARPDVAVRPADHRRRHRQGD
jgi:hypothetical protein